MPKVLTISCSPDRLSFWAFFHVGIERTFAKSPSSSLTLNNPDKEENTNLKVQLASLQQKVQQLEKELQDRKSS